MLNSRTPLIAAALAVTALAPAAAFAASASSAPVLKSSPQMRIVDATHATLKFASERLPRTRTGGLDAKITSAGLAVTNLRATGRHGSDTVYTASVASTADMVAHEKFAVRFRLGRSPSVTRSVKLYAPSELHP
jgi:hypothetical protein